MSNRYDHDYPDDTNEADLMPYDDTFSEEYYVAELIAEGYSEDEARRMAGEYNPEDYYGSDEGIERDIPDVEEFDTNDFVDEEDTDE